MCRKSFRWRLTFWAPPLSQFVVQAALDKAEKVIENEESIYLTRRESLRLLELIENPPPRNEKFLNAQARYLKGREDVLPTVPRNPGLLCHRNHRVDPNSLLV